MAILIALNMYLDSFGDILAYCLARGGGFEPPLLSYILSSEAIPIPL